MVQKNDTNNNADIHFCITENKNNSRKRKNKVEIKDYPLRSIKLAAVFHCVTKKTSPMVVKVMEIMKM